MPNVIITYACNQDCSFCFAEKNNTGPDYDLKTIQSQFPFLDSFEKKSLNLIGGEPTLNPEFIPILLWLLSKDYEVNVFSNGILDSKLIGELKTIASEKVHFIVNRSEPKKKAQITNFYRSLGYLIQLSATIFQPGQSLSHIKDEIIKYRLLKEFRLGIALPVYHSRRNKFLNPNQYKIVAKEIVAFIEECIPYGIRPSFDCGFPFCFFDEEQKQLLNNCGVVFQSNCGIIPDINADNELIPCFPLHAVRSGFKNSDKWETIKKGVLRNISQNAMEAVFPFCSSCDDRDKGNCNGGCLSLQLVKSRDRVLNVQ